MLRKYSMLMLLNFKCLTYLIINRKLKGKSESFFIQAYTSIVAPIAVPYTLRAPLQFHHFNGHTCMHTIEIEPVETEPELQEELAQAETSANPDHTQDKPRCIPPKSLTFILTQYFRINLIVH
jgi:hypothetical protein